MAIGDLEGMGYIVHSYRVRLLSTKKKENMSNIAMVD